MLTNEQVRKAERMDVAMGELYGIVEVGNRFLPIWWEDTFDAKMEHDWWKQECMKASSKEIAAGLWWAIGIMAGGEQEPAKDALCLKSELGTERGVRLLEVSIDGAKNQQQVVDRLHRALRRLGAE